MVNRKSDTQNIVELPKQKKRTRYEPPMSHLVAFLLIFLVGLIVFAIYGHNENETVENTVGELKMALELSEENSQNKSPTDFMAFGFHDISRELVPIQFHRIQFEYSKKLSSSQILIVLAIFFVVNLLVVYFSFWLIKVFISCFVFLAQSILGLILISLAIVLLFLGFVIIFIIFCFVSLMVGLFCRFNNMLVSFFGYLFSFFA